MMTLGRLLTMGKAMMTVVTVICGSIQTVQNILMSSTFF